MSENCTHNCAECGADCPSRGASAEDFRAPANRFSEVKHVIGVVSGKGGVGKSLVASLMAVMMRRKGFTTAILDADITGPSIPKAFGVTQPLNANDYGIFPAETATGIKLVSLNLMLENPTDPVVWRGPVIAGAVKQFWSDVMWGDVDFMFVDMPPGTGDVPLTVFQSLPLDGIIIVTSPQDLVGLIVEKAARMAKMMNIPVLGLVENYAYYDCPDCGTRHYIFGRSRLNEVADQLEIPNTAQLPIDPAISAACDTGKAEMIDGDWLDGLVDAIGGRA